MGWERTQAFPMDSHLLFVSLWKNPFLIGTSFFDSESTRLDLFLKCFLCQRNKPFLVSGSNSPRFRSEKCEMGGWVGLFPLQYYYQW